jgi:hypothetical protein
MNRFQFEHVVKAAAAVAGIPEIVVVGSQAVLGLNPNPPPALLASIEVDLCPLGGGEEATDAIEGALGIGSAFHSSHQYYAHGVGPDTATLPRNWLSRAVRVSTPYMAGAVAICPCATDLAISKLAAGREKDMAYVAVMVAEGMTGWHDMRAALLAELPDGMPRSRLLEALGILEARQGRAMTCQSDETKGVTP